MHGISFQGVALHIFIYVLFMEQLVHAVFSRILKNGSSNAAAYLFMVFPHFMELHVRGTCHMCAHIYFKQYSIYLGYICTTKTYRIILVISSI